jgi:hypothetical protein
MLMFRPAPPFSLKDENPGHLLAVNAALCRAVAQIHGLLSGGRNRKMVIANPLRSEHAGAAWTSPENHL